jgi:hypothetical protein
MHLCLPCCDVRKEQTGSHLLAGWGERTRRAAGLFLLGLARMKSRLSGFHLGKE